MPSSRPSEQGSPVPPPSRWASRPWDVVLTRVLLIALVPLALVASFLGLFGAMLTDTCSGDQQCLDSVTVGVTILVAAPIVCWVLALVVSRSLVRRGLLAWWVPPVAVVLWFVAVLVGGSIAGA